MRDLTKTFRLRVDFASSGHGLDVMNARLRAAVRVVLAIAAVLTDPTVSFAQVKVLISGGFSAAYQELLPEFERTAGTKVTTTTGGSVGTGPNTIGSQLRRGVPADVVILAREGLSELIAEGRVVAGTDVDLARSIIGMIVRAGAPKPDISTVEALKQTLLHAKSVAVSTSTSGVYLTTQLFPRLGIADQMAGKTITSGSAAVGRGEAEIGLQQVSEVLQVQGADFVGAIPADVQYVTVYAAAIVTGSKEIEASKGLIAFLASEGATQAIRKSGMEPLRPR
jgi:molybdate transport system substrate-binding protein